MDLTETRRILGLPLDPDDDPAPAEPQDSHKGHSYLYGDLRRRTRYMSFGGGGTGGLAFLGCLINLYNDSRENWLEHLKALKGCSGCSMGAALAVLIAAGCAPWEIAQVMLAQDMSIVSMTAKRENIMPSLINLFKSGSVAGHGGLRTLLVRVFVKLMGEGIRDITFDEFTARYGRELIIVAYNKTHGRTECMSAERTPKCKVVDAVIASMSIPYLFGDHVMDAGHMSDGGVMEILPILRTPIEETLGFYIQSASPGALGGPFGVFRGLIQAQVATMIAANPSIMDQVVWVDVDPSLMMKFDASPADKLRIIGKGKVSMEAFVYFELQLALLICRIPMRSDPFHEEPLSPREHPETDGDTDSDAATDGSD